MNVKRDALLITLSVIFFLSGFTALLYQVIWQRMLGLFSGSDVRSIAIVVAAYLAGLGIGNLLGSLFSDRFDNRRAVQIYGLCNLGIAGFAAVSKLIFYDVLYRQLSFVDLPMGVILVVIFVSLLVPTTLMGMSLPLLSRALVQNLDQAPRVIGLLYGVNTLGSALGTLLTGWVIAGTLGYELSIYFGATLNFILGIAALLISNQFILTRGIVSGRSRFAFTNDISSEVWRWAALVLIAGFIAISLELVWFRVLVVALKSNAYTYGHFLAFILLGNATGSLLGVKGVRSSRNPRSVFLVVIVLVVVCALASVWLLALLSSGSSWLQIYLQRTAGYLVLDGTIENILPTTVVMILLPALILLPPNILLGYYFPFVQKAIQTDEQVIGGRVGFIGVANVLGNTLGSLITGLVALEYLGTRGTLLLIGMLGLIMALVFIGEKKPTKWRTLLPAGILVALVVFFPAPTTLWSQLLGYDFDQGVIAVDDASGVSIIRPEEEALQLYVDGILQGTIPYLPVHTFLGVMPSLIHPQPEQVLVIGIGSGGTAYSVGVNPTIERIIAVEIIGSEIPALQMVLETNPDSPLRPFLEDPRIQMQVGDGRREMVLSNTQYDIIEADAIYPWRSHAGMPYSREFFNEARLRLAENGIMAQWAPTPRVQATFLSVFPYVVDIGNNVLIGSESEIEYNPEQLLEQLQEEGVVRYLSAASVDIDVLRDIITNHQPRFWMPDSPRVSSDFNTDLFPRDEYYLNMPISR